MADTMRAIFLDAPGPPDALTIRELPVPTPAAGWVLIEVKAFGLNRSELHTRQGLASGDVTAGSGHRGCRRRRPVPGRGVPRRPPGRHHDGRHGHTFDGSYAEYTCVPARQVVPL